MKLTPRGERVFAFSLVFTTIALVGALMFGAQFLLTHHTETDKNTCHYSAEADGMMCDWHWEAN
jgi:hypothetical protein